MATKIQQRRDTAANWAASNPILAQGELAVVLDDPTVIKRGDGTTPWNALAPFTLTPGRTRPDLLVVADNGWGSEAQTTPTSTVGTAAHPFTIGMSVTELVLRYAHSYMLADLDIDPAGAITFNVSLKVISSTNPNVTLNKLIPVTFGGKKIASLDPGGHLQSDPLPIELLAGDRIEVRTYLASGTAYPYRPTTTRVANGGGFTAASDLTPPGSAAVIATNTYNYGPASVLGRPDPTQKVVALGNIGDSIAYSGGDQGAQFSQPLLGLGSYGIRALTGRGGFINLAYSGDTMANYLTTTAKVRRATSLSRVNAVFCGYGVNDLAGGTVTAAQLQANILTAAKTVASMGIKKFFIHTLTPRTTSTDGWTTLGGQTAIAADPARITHNTWVRAGCPIDPTTLAPVLPGTEEAILAGSFRHPITGWLDFADLVESSRNSGLWKVAQRTAHYNVTNESNVLTLTDSTFSIANLEVGGDNGSIVLLSGWNTTGVFTESGVAVLTTTTAATSVLATQTVSAGTVVINPSTADGTHPSSSSYIAMAQLLISRLQEFAN